MSRKLPTRRLSPNPEEATGRGALVCGDYPVYKALLTKGFLEAGNALPPPLPSGAAPPRGHEIYVESAVAKSLTTCTPPSLRRITPRSSKSRMVLLTTSHERPEYDAITDCVMRLS